MSLPNGPTFVRLDGSGGDGGVECFADHSDGSRVGWQAKYVFKVDALIRQVSKSFDTAITVHHELTKYVICFPFDPTGPTNRQGKSGETKLQEWKNERVSAARKEGRRLEIEFWPKSRLLSELLKVDRNGGIRAFFFDETVLSTDWFKKHLASANATAGPRYTPQLNVETDLWKWFDALGQTETWTATFRSHFQNWSRSLDEINRAVRRNKGGPLDPAWPESGRSDVEACMATLDEARQNCAELINSPSREAAIACRTQLLTGLQELAAIDEHLSTLFDEDHGSGASNSVGFRQIAAELNCAFPAANLDAVRETIDQTQQLNDWLNSPGAWSAFERVLILLGAAGSGKTHGICDAAARRLKDGRLSIVAFGNEFKGEPETWTRLRESLGLPSSLGRDSLLDALNAAGEASGSPLIVFLDAINESRPLSYWQDRLDAIVAQVGDRPFIRVCASCRTSYRDLCIPNKSGFYQATHKGFLGVESVACKAFFEYYDLEPPVAPILQPELANPLYLRILCSTLQTQGLKRMPHGWVGLAPVINAFLYEKDKAFGREEGRLAGGSLASKCLLAVARGISVAGESAIPYALANRLIQDEHNDNSAAKMLDWLIGEDLLIEDAPGPTDPPGTDSVLRLAFERLGDFLVARAALEGWSPADLAKECREGGRLFSFLGSPETVATHYGVVSALTILIPEEKEDGTELPELLPKGDVRTSVLGIAVKSYPWRNPSSFSLETESNLKEAMSIPGIAWDAVDSVLTVSFIESAIDADWFSCFMRSIPMAERDAFLCAYLHDRFDGSGPVRRLIDAAFDVPLDQIDREVALRWATMLLWFTAAADRRVKDNATRAAFEVLATHGGALSIVLDRMMDIDDDAVRERILLVAYGVCIRNCDCRVTAEVCRYLVEAIERAPQSLHNALLRDHILSIAELAQRLGRQDLHDELAASLDSLVAPWPLELPDQSTVESWKQLPGLFRSCCHGDFFIYGMGCLRKWESGVTRKEMAEWILKRIAEDFGYADSDCAIFDKHMLHKYGPGRARQKWAERIGKKYQWIAMYQLAAHLADHVEIDDDKGGPELLRQPLILLQKRQLDPTLPKHIANESNEGDAWWIPAHVDLETSASLTDTAWVRRKNDVPNLCRLLSPFSEAESHWRLLDASNSWGECRGKAEYNLPYREVWIHVTCYLVECCSSIRAFSALRNRNFFGMWMPEGASWCYGFAGEYPWGAAFNTETDEWHSSGGGTYMLPCELTPVCNQLAVEWEYDASLLRNLHMKVPARRFFDGGDLWWDHLDGYGRQDGKTVLRDPSVVESGPSSLIGDSDYLDEFLKQSKCQLIWTLLGEKRVLSGDKPKPSRTFSQVALLNEDRTFECGDLVFFTNYEKDVGPNPKPFAKQSARNASRSKVKGDRTSRKKKARDPKRRKGK